MTRPVDHDSDERFADWVDERLSARDRERFEAELRVNPRLRERAERYRDQVLKIRAAMRAPIVPPIDLADAVLARLGGAAADAPAAAPARSVLPRRGLRWRQFALSMTAAAALVATVLVLTEMGPKTPARLDTAATEPAPVALTANDEADRKDLPGAPATAGDGEARAEPTRKLAADQTVLETVLTEKEASERAPAEKTAEGGAPANKPEAERFAADKSGGERPTAAQPAAEPTGPGLADAAKSELKVAEQSTRAEPAPDPADRGTEQWRQQVAGRLAGERLLQLGRDQTDVTRLPQVQFQRARGAAQPSAVVEQLQLRLLAQNRAALQQLEQQVSQAAAKAPAPAQTPAIGSLVVQPLGAAPGFAAQLPDVSGIDLNAAGRDDFYLGALREGAAAPRTGAWLVEGDADEVRSFLSGLAAAAEQQGGYQLLTAEVPVANVLAVLPALPQVPGEEPPIAGFQEVRPVAAAPTAPTAGRRNEAQGAAGAPRPAPAGPAGAAGPATPGPAGPATGGPAGPTTGSADPKRRGQQAPPPAALPQERFRVVVVVQEADAPQQPAEGARK